MVKHVGQVVPIEDIEKILYFTTSVVRIDDSRLAEIFAREVLAMLVRQELLSPEWAERILSWPHSGFNVHSLVRAKTKPEAERVGKYMLRPVLALERLTFLEPEGKVGYRWGRDGPGLKNIHQHGKTGRDGEDDDSQGEEDKPQGGGVLEEVLVDADDREF